MQFDTKNHEGYLHNSELEAELGVWVDFPGDVSYRILRAGGDNYPYRRALAKMLRTHKKEIEKGTLDPRTQDLMLRELFAKYVLKDWKGITSNGEPVPYTWEAGLAYFNTFPKRYDELTELAQEELTFSMAEIDDVKDELGKSSNGRLSMASKPKL